jgi:hypothetical protein
MHWLLWPLRRGSSKVRQAAELDVK